MSMSMSMSMRTVTFSRPGTRRPPSTCSCSCSCRRSRRFSHATELFRRTRPLELLGPQPEPAGHEQDLGDLVRANAGQARLGGAEDGAHAGGGELALGVAAQVRE